MKKKFKKIAPAVFVATLFLVVGIFFAKTVVLAADSTGLTAMDCGDGRAAMHDAACDQYNQRIQNSKPADNSFMPCCIERHDNSGTTLPSTLRERINFSEYTTVENVVSSLIVTQQKSHLSSKSPPEKADILSSVVKIE